MKRQAPVALVLLVLLATAGHVKGDFFGNLLTSMAKQLFNHNGPTVSSAPVEGGPTDVGKVPHGSILEEAFQSELDAAVQQAEAMEANKTGTPAGEITPDYKDVEEVLEEQLEEEVVDLEQDVVEQKKKWDADGHQDAMLEELEAEDYAEVKERVEDVEELVDEFNAARKMADEIALRLGKDVTVTMQDRKGNSYAVGSNLAAAKNATKSATKSLVDLDTQVGEEVAEIAAKLGGGDGAVDVEADPMASNLFERALEDEEADAAGRGVFEPLARAYDMVGGAEAQQDGPEGGVAHGLEGGEVVHAPDTTFAEGKALGREAKATVLASQTDLEHMEATEEHSSRVRFVVSAVLPATSSDHWPEKTMEHNLTSSVIRDIDLAAGYYYDQDDAWEPGFGVYFNKTVSNYYESGYNVVLHAEIIYPVDYNQKDIEIFVHRLVTDPAGIFKATRKHLPMVKVAVSQKVEYCSNDWTFWSFTTEDGDWALEQHAEGQREAHQCWYNARAKAGVTEDGAEGREAEATVLTTQTDLEHMEATEQHSSRVRFVVSAVLPATSSDHWPDRTMEFNLTACVIRDIELAAGYYYDQDDAWEPGFGVYFNNTVSNYYDSGYDAVYDAEIIYPVSYNQDDIELFVQRLVSDPVGIFETTRKYHPMAGVSVSQKVEYCSNDWTFWSFTTASGDWALEQHAEGQREAHQCWYNARAKAGAKQYAPVPWGMQNMWMLIGAMLVTGGLAAAIGALLVYYCCNARPADEDDMMPRQNRRYIIESRLKGKGGNPLSALRRKSERMWRRNQYMPHADPCDLVNMHVNPAEPDPHGSHSKLQELAESYSAPTWHPHNIDLDEKYGKKFSKQTKFTWVGDYKTQYARRARAKAAALAKEVADKEKETAKAGCSSESESPDIPTSFDDGDSPVEMYGNTITKRAAAGKSSW